MTVKAEILNAAQLANSHYENFPVAPFFLPKKYREAISLIYAFARMADDIADEGDLSAELRMEKLDRLTQELCLIEQQRDPSTDFFKALNNIIVQYQLPVYLFKHLLQAFKQDVVVSRYRNFEQVLDYCQYSANPIGRLLLILTQNDNAKTVILSDKICTALQLINFLQDTDSDLCDRNRLYLPDDLMNFYQVSEDDLRAKKQTPQIQNLIDHVWIQTHTLLQAGQPLGKQLSGRFGLAIRLIIYSGNRVLHKLKTRSAFYERPVLRRSDYLLIALKSLI